MRAVTPDGPVRGTAWTSSTKDPLDQVSRRSSRRTRRISIVARENQIREPAARSDAVREPGDDGRPCPRDPGALDVRAAQCAVSSALIRERRRRSDARRYAVFETPPEGDTRVFSTSRLPRPPRHSTTAAVRFSSSRSSTTPPSSRRASSTRCSAARVRALPAPFSGDTRQPLARY